MISPYNGISRLGKNTADTWQSAYAMIGLFYDTVVATFYLGKKRFTPLLNQIIGQLLFTGVEAFALMALIGLISGITIVMQAMANMPKIGIGEYFGNILIMAVVRELGPLFTALIIIGRSGTALAAYIGNMKVTREITALEVMAIDPVNFLVLPAFWGIVISMICLNVYYDIVALVGGIFIAHMTSAATAIPISIFMGKVLNALTWFDIVISLFKSVLFGSVVAIVSCYHGMQVKTVRDVPQACIRSVVVSMGAMIVADILITLILVMLKVYA